MDGAALPMTQPLNAEPVSTTLAGIDNPAHGKTWKRRAIEDFKKTGNCGVSCCIKFSLLSTGICCFGTLLCVNGLFSMLSVNSAFSILSVNSAVSILSFNSAFSIHSWQSAFSMHSTYSVGSWNSTNSFFSVNSEGTIFSIGCTPDKMGAATYTQGDGSVHPIPRGDHLSYTYFRICGSPTDPSFPGEGAKDYLADNKFWAPYLSGFRHPSQIPKCVDTDHPDDCSALKDLFLATHSTLWWNAEGMCNWPGIMCDAPHGVTRVTGIKLSNVTGTLPSTLASMTDLRRLELDGKDGNDISGTLPYELGQLSNLYVLRLHGNGKLAGGGTSALPGGLRELTLGDPGGSALTGSLQNMSDLTTLIVDHTAISGTIPAAFGANTALRIMSMAYNRLSGTIPALAGREKGGGPWTLQLSGNPLSGTVPDVFAAFPDWPPYPEGACALDHIPFTCPVPKKEKNGCAATCVPSRSDEL